MTPAAPEKSLVKGLKKYLDGYAEPEASRLAQFADSYHFSLVIPAYQEDAEQINRIWQQIPDNVDFLVILVINAPSAPDATGIELFNAITQRHQQVQIADGITLIQPNTGPDILAIDRYSEGRNIPPTRGVGLARKIGSDIALRLHHQGLIASDWLFTTDADAILPRDYFDITPDASDVACVYPFRHSAIPQLELAVRLYEIHLLHYAAGLLSAGSPYGYPTVGSTICCRATSYAAVRGYPQRNTGEDFYLLNKLRKIGTIGSTATTPITLEGRLSTRVPIGTGQAIAKISQLDDPLRAYPFDHPDCFARLRELIDFFHQLATEQPESITHPDTVILNYINKTGLSDKYLTKRSQNPSPEVMTRFLMGWFDGLKTRQFIHHLRDTVYGTASIADLSQSAMINVEWTGESSLEKIRARLSQSVYHQTGR